MNHEEEEYQRRRHHRQRPQAERRHERDRPDINDFRSRWKEPSSEYLHPRQRQWHDEDYYRGSERGDHREINDVHNQRRERTNSYQSGNQVRPQEDHREFRRDYDDYRSDNQHANDRWYEDNYRRQYRHRYLEERPRDRYDDFERDDHRNR